MDTDKAQKNHKKLASENLPMPAFGVSFKFRKFLKIVIVIGATPTLSGRWKMASDITRWIAYFIKGMATSFVNVRNQAVREAERGG
ncbi:MAG: hypothetical protein ABSB15_23585 [Bryobacteraceae bacterium]|jgi:hypothetical protein